MVGHSFSAYIHSLEGIKLLIGTSQVAIDCLEMQARDTELVIQAIQNLLNHPGEPDWNHASLKTKNYRDR